MFLGIFLTTVFVFFGISPRLNNSKKQKYYIILIKNQSELKKIKLYLKKICRKQHKLIWGIPTLIIKNVFINLV